MEHPQAEAVLNYVDPERVIRLLQAMVRIPSPTFEEGPLAEFIAAYLEDLGIETKLLEVSDPDGSGKKSKQPVGIIRGEGSGPSLMFNGHMDHNRIAGTLDDWDRDPYSGDRDQEYIYGRGSIDEKGGIAGLLTAAEAIQKWGIPLKGDLLLCPVVAHKTDSVGSRHNHAMGIRADLCINTETTDLGVITAGIGVVRVDITFKGRPVHFSSPPEKKKQAFFAVQEMARFVTQLGEDVQPLAQDGWLSFEPEPEMPGYPQLSVMGIESEYYPVNYCKLFLQVRTVPGQTAETVRADLEQLLASFGSGVPNMEALIEAPPKGGGKFPAWNFLAYKIPQDHVLPQTMSSWHEFVSGRPAELGAGPRLGACGDANFIATTGTPTVQYGPGGLGEYDQWPAINERIKIEDLLVGARTMALTAAEICGA